jgi:hypothetical protein
MNWSIFATLLFVSPITPETARFNITQDGRRIGSEEFTISARQGGYVAEGRTQLEGDPVSITSRMEMDERLNPTSYEYRRGTATIRVKIESLVSEYETMTNGQRSTVDFRFPGGGFIVDNNFFHHYLLLLYKIGAVENTLPVFVPQDMRMGSATVRPKGNGVFDLEMGDVKLEATTDASGRLIRLVVPDARIVIQR